MSATKSLFFFGNHSKILFRCRRKKFLTFLSRITGKKLSAEMMEYFMEKDPFPGSAVPVHKLHTLFDQALLATPEELNELYQLSIHDLPLSDRWYHTYNG